MYEIILIGAGGHAKAYIDVIETEKRFKIAGLIEKEKIETEKILGYPFIGTDDDLRALKNGLDDRFYDFCQIFKSYMEKFS